MVVNGVIWPKDGRGAPQLPAAAAERHGLALHGPALPPRQPRSDTTLQLPCAPLPFWVIGSDQGLASRATQTDTLVVEPGGRYDVVIDFSQVNFGTRSSWRTSAGDAPFGGDFGDALTPEDLFPDRQTDRIMAFDVVVPTSGVPDAFDPSIIDHYDTRQPRAGHADAPRWRSSRATTSSGACSRCSAPPSRRWTNLAGNTVNGAIAWHSPTTEKPGLDTTEIWEIYNAPGTPIRSTCTW